MKIRDTDNEIYTSKKEETTSFQMMASAKAFRILSDGVYTFKERAVIREYLCNAFDSHVMSGNTQDKVEVHLPTFAEPWFEVVDKGLGLSKEDVKEIFTVYFLSTKTQTDDAVGCLGIGSKSAFAVSDQFLVTSVKDGKKIVYSCYMNFKGEPDAELKFECDTDEQNGVTIKIPVDTSDTDKWHREYAYVVAGFGSKDAFSDNCRDYYKGLYSNHKKMVEKAIENGYSVDYKNGTGECFAIMGNILYRVPSWKQFISDRNPLSRHLRSVGNGSTVYLSFEMGQIDFSPSREELSLDSKTRKNLKHKINRSVIDIYNKDFKHLNIDVDNFYNFYKQLHNSSVVPLISDLKVNFSKNSTVSDIMYYNSNGQTVVNGYVECLKDFEGTVRSTSPWGGYKNSNSRIYGADVERMVSRGTQFKIYLSDGPVRGAVTALKKKELDFSAKNLVVYYCTNEKDANKIAEYFNLSKDFGDITTIIPERKKTAYNRKGYGKVESTTFLAVRYTIENGELNKYDYNIVDPSVLDVVSITSEEFYSLGRSLVKKMMETLEVNTVVIQNKTNGGKIKRNGVLSLKSKFETILTQDFNHLIRVNIGLEDFKHEYIDSYFLDEYDDMVTNLFMKRLGVLNQKKKQLDKYIEKINNTELLEYSKDQICTINSALYDNRFTKRIQKETERSENIKNHIKNQYEKLLNKYKLIGFVRHEDESDVIHYLKLEKFKFTNEEKQAYAI